MLERTTTLTRVLEPKPQLEAVMTVAGTSDAQVALSAGRLLTPASGRRPLPRVAVRDGLVLPLNHRGLAVKESVFWGWGMRGRDKGAKWQLRYAGGISGGMDVDRIEHATPHTRFAVMWRFECSFADQSSDPSS